jgi:histidyl-tRNA synthetase
MRDWLPQDALLRQHLMETISKVYRLYGYLPIDTPAMEDLSVLLDKGGGENEKLLFKVLKRGEKLDEARSGGDLADYGLRFDLTVPLARFVATHQGKLPKVFRRYHIAPVWRADRPQKGRFREFYQCDIDVVGGASPDYEVEIITATERVLKELNLGKYRFRLSDKRLLPLVLRGFGVSEEQVGPITVVLDKLDKIARAEVLTDIRKILSQNKNALGRVESFVEEAAEARSTEKGRLAGPDDFKGLFEKVPNQAVRSELQAILDNLTNIIHAVRTVNPDSATTFDPVLVRGMDYYTGPVYEAVVEGYPSAILGGGRYDDLIGQFAGKKIPAVGCSIGFERILSILQERKSGQASATVSRVLLVNDGQPDDLLQQQAEQLRNAGICVETYLDPDDPGKQFKYAETACILWAIRRFNPSSSAVTVRYLPERRDLTMPLADFLARLNSAK